MSSLMPSIRPSNFILSPDMLIYPAAIISKSNAQWSYRHLVSYAEGIAATTRTNAQNSLKPTDSKPHESRIS